jgi:hypothetical protein
MAPFRRSRRKSWALASATYAGRGRGGTGEFGVEREVKVTIASGAPINCGTECTMAQDDKTLTISRADQPGTTPPDVGVVMLNLDGSESTITQSDGSTYPHTRRLMTANCLCRATGRISSSHRRCQSRMAH